MSEVHEALKKTLADIEDMLAKSSSLQKAEDKKEEKKEDKMEKAEGDEQEQQAPVEQEAAPEAPAAPAEMAPEAPAEQAPAAEGQEGEQSQEESAEQHASSLSDEELDMMLQVLMAEKEKRSSAQSEGQEGQEQSQEAPAQEAQPEQMQMSMKDDYAKMHKSMESLVSMVTDLKAEVAASKAAPAAQKPAQAKTTSKAAASNLKDVQVLEKSTPVAKRLSKSETNEFLQGQIRKKNPLVSSKNIVDLNYINSDEELHAMQDELTKKGLEFPKF